jgi:hypothetical protein
MMVKCRPLLHVAVHDPLPSQVLFSRIMSALIVIEGSSPVQSFLQQLPALLGVLLGVIATYATTSAAERGRWRRAQSVRWDEKRVNAYVEYALALKKVISVTVRITAPRSPDTDSGGPPSEDLLAALEEAEEQRTTKWEAVLLLGTNDVVIAGRKWHDCVFRLQRLARGQPSDMTRSEAIEATSHARRNFYEVAKRDIGIAVGASPEAYEWQITKFDSIGIDGS